MAAKPPKEHEAPAPAAIEMTDQEKLKHVINLEAGLNHALVTIRQYCIDLKTGNYVPKLGEDRLIHIQNICIQALAGLWNVGVEDGDPSGG